jgi:hypothetical protein
MPVSLRPLLLFSVLLLGAGCGFTDVFQKTSETVAQKAAEGAANMALQKQFGKDVDLDVNAQGAVFTDTGSGRTFAIGERVDIPSSFPNDIPRHDDCAPTSVSVDASKSQAALICVSAKTPSEMRTWYEAAAVSNGWTLKQTQDILGSVQLTFTRSDTSALLMVSIATGGNGKTTLTVARSKGE